MQAMTKEEARNFRDRWRMVNEVISREIRNATPELRLQRLRTVFASAHRFSAKHRSVDEDDGVRVRWNLLKDRLHV